MTTDWTIRVGDGSNFRRSCRHRIWGIQTTTSTHGKHFVKNVKPGDRLWFVTSNSNGRIIAVATYRSHNTRVLGPLLELSMTSEELGWTGEGPDWTSNVELHYTDLYGLNDCELLTHIKGQTTIMKYNEKCMIDLPAEYPQIVRYSKVVTTL